MSKLKISIAVLVLSLIVTQHAFAVGSAGFENATFSSESLGQANAVVAQAHEPAAISYNPAGITQLNGLQIQSNSGFISSFTYYESNVQGDARSTGTLKYVPTAYITVNPGGVFGNRVSFGIGSDSPFGLSKKYESTDPIARYTGHDTWLEMYAIKPVVAVKLHERLSVGAGPVFYDIFDLGATQKYPNALLPSPPFPAGLPDGQVRANLEGRAWGWQMGVLAKPYDKHQLGFYFRSPVTVHTSGSVEVEGAFSGGNFSTGARAKVDLPLNFTFAYAYKPTNKTTIEADFGFTRWAAHERLFIDADPVNAADDGILEAIGKNPKDYRNSFAIHLGGNHQLNSKWKILGGGYWMTAAVPKTHFLPSVPDANRLAFSLGAIYSPSANWDVGLTYLGTFNLRRHINNSISEVLGTSVDGTYYSYTQVLTFTITYKWEDFAQIFEGAPKA